MPQERRSKYGAVKTSVDGIVFASKAEARRWSVLQLRVKAGEICGLLRQPVYRLFVRPFGGRDAGELVEVGKYIGDFQYWEGDARVVEDVKGVKTPVYQLKKRIVEALYGIRIKEIR